VVDRKNKTDTLTNLLQKDKQKPLFDFETIFNSSKPDLFPDSLDSKSKLSKTDGIINKSKAKVKIDEEKEISEMTEAEVVEKELKEKADEAEITEQFEIELNKLFEKNPQDKLKAEKGRSLPYRSPVEYLERDKKDKLKPGENEGNTYQTDIYIYEINKENRDIPRIVVELKKIIPNTHEMITYSDKAGEHKIILPHVRYGIIAFNENNGNKLENLPKRMFMHSENFDFMMVINWKNKDEFNKGIEMFYEKIIKEEIKSSKDIEKTVFTPDNKFKDIASWVRKDFVIGKPNKTEENKK
jgi:hypothetical protein